MYHEVFTDTGKVHEGLDTNGVEDRRVADTCPLPSIIIEQAASENLPDNSSNWGVWIAPTSVIVNGRSTPRAHQSLPAARMTSSRAMSVPVIPVSFIATTLTPVALRPSGPCPKFTFVAFGAYQY